MYPHAPPIPPPKPGNHEASRMGTPAASPLPNGQQPENLGAGSDAQARALVHLGTVPDPGNQWLPKFLEEKSKQDLATVLSDTKLLTALTHAPVTMHASLAMSRVALQAALADNVELAGRVSEAERRAAHQRAATQAQLLATHALERQWRAKQADMDRALAPFAPASLYQRLLQGVQEQAGVCAALEETFLERAPGDVPGDGPGGDGGQTSEREAAEWVRRYREAKKLYYLRQDRKERWDEGRVGGWR